MTEDEPLTFAGIWHDSPLVRDDVIRILTAPRLPIVLADTVEGLIETTLAHIAGTAFKLRLWKREVPGQTRERIRQHFVGLTKAVMSIELVINSPPQIPSEWGMDMAAWLGEPPAKTIKGSPMIEHDWYIVPMLLAFYEVVYDRSASHTVDGPTERFITEFFLAFNRVVAGAKWAEESVVPRLDPAADIRRMVGDQARDRIRIFKNKANTNVMRKLIMDLTTVVEAGSWQQPGT